MKALSVLLLLALPAVALAQDSGFQPRGEYLFRTDAVQNGQPVCTEVWTFGDDGKLAIESGAERVQKLFHIETDRDGTWIVSETLSTNGQPDCMGHATPTVTPGERRSHIVPLNNGTVVTCPPPGHTSDGIPITGDCYGRLIPMDQVG